MEKIDPFEKDQKTLTIFQKQVQNIEVRLKASSEEP